jgi:hypothetical protein
VRNDVVREASNPVALLFAALVAVSVEEPWDGDEFGDASVPHGFVAVSVEDISQCCADAKGFAREGGVVSKASEVCLNLSEFFGGLDFRRPAVT